MSDSDLPATATRLNKLFSDIRPEGRRGRRFTNDEVAAAVKRDNPQVRVTGSYLSALRTGAKRNPSVDLLVAVARFFGVPASYFLDARTAAQADAEIELAKVANNLGVRKLALRALELSPEGLAAVTQIVEHVLQADRFQRPDRHADPEHEDVAPTAVPRPGRSRRARRGG